MCKFLSKSLVQKSYVQMNKNDKTEKLIYVDCRKIFSSEIGVKKYFQKGLT
jgi:hypothetical protein